MTTENFKKFADYYDIIYSDKNYTNEVRYIIKKINAEKYKVKNILDIGCGTGNHAINLATKGFQVTGVDKSKRNIEIAKEKARQKKVKIKFLEKDINRFKPKEKFDLCISMFSSLCYLSGKEFKKSIKNIFNSLNPGGLLIFDYWNGCTVIIERPSIKIKKVSSNSLKITRIATPTLDLEMQKCAIEYNCIIKKKSKIIDKFKEIHTMRYYFPAEMKETLENTGFININFETFSGRKIQKNDFLDNWYIVTIAKKPN